MSDIVFVLSNKRNKVCQNKEKKQNKLSRNVNKRNCHIVDSNASSSPRSTPCARAPISASGCSSPSACTRSFRCWESSAVSFFSSGIRGDDAPSTTTHSDRTPSCSFQTFGTSWATGDRRRRLCSFEKLRCLAPLLVVFRTIERDSFHLRLRDIQPFARSVNPVVALR